jgi:site-specific recombinase XerC
MGILVRYSARCGQQIVKEIAEKAKIKKRVYPHLLRHSVATTLLERGMPIEQIQKFLGPSKLETTYCRTMTMPPFTLIRRTRIEDWQKSGESLRTFMQI